MNGNQDQQTIEVPASVKTAKPTDGHGSASGAAPATRGQGASGKPQDTPSRRSRRTKKEGVPAAPAAVAGVDTLAMSAAQLGPYPTAAVAGAAVLAGAAALVRRRSRRGPDLGRSGTIRTGSGSTGLGSGSRRSGSGYNNPGSGSRGRSGSGPSTSTGRTTSGSGGSRSGLAGSRSGSAVRPDRGPGRSGSGRSGLLGRISDRRSGSGSAGSRRSGPSRIGQTMRSGGRGVANAGRAVRSGGRGVGRATQRAWQSRAARATRSGITRSLRKGRGVALPVAAVLARGAWAALQGKSRSEIRRAMGETWRRLRAKYARRSKHAKKKKDDNSTNVPGSTVNKPVNAVTLGKKDSANAPTGDFDMRQAQFIDAAAEMLGAALSYQPESMVQVGNDFAKMPQAFQNIANAMKHMAQRANDDDPIHPVILDQMGVVYTHLQAAADAAGELAPAFEKLHHVDLERIRNPRRNEQKWDFESNRSA